jgi:hypothetical protein
MVGEAAFLLTSQGRKEPSGRSMNHRILAFYLPALYLFLVVFSLDLYARINAMAEQRAMQNLIDALVVSAAFADSAVPALVVPELILNAARYGMIAYGIVLIATRLSSIAEKTLRRMEGFAHPL